MTPPSRTRKKFARPFNATNLNALIAKYHDGNKTEAARRIGLSQSQLYEIATEPYSRISGETLELIARAYDVTMDFAYGRQDVRAREDTFAAGVLHAITVMQQTIDGLGARRGVDHLRPDIDQAARVLLSDAGVPAGSARVTIPRELPIERPMTTPVVPAAKFPTVVRDPSVPATKKRRGRPTKKRRA